MALGLAVAEAHGQRFLPIDGQEIENVAIGVAIHTHDIADVAQWLTMHYRF